MPTDQILIDIVTHAEDTIAQFATLSGGLLVAGEAYKKISEQIIGDMEAYKELSTNVTILNTALKNTGDVSGTGAQALREYASVLQNTTTFSDDAALKASGLLASLGHLNSDGIQSLLPHIADLATGMGETLPQAAEMIAKVLDGSSTMGLTRFGIQVDKNADQSTKLTEIINGLQRKFGGLAEAVGGEPIATMDKLKNVNEELAAQLGSRFARDAQPMLDWLIKFKSAWVDALKAENDWFDAHAKVAAGVANTTEKIIDQEGSIHHLQDALDMMVANPQAGYGMLMTLMDQAPAKYERSVSGAQQYINALEMQTHMLKGVADAEAAKQQAQQKAAQAESDFQQKVTEATKAYSQTEQGKIDELYQEIDANNSLIATGKLNYSQTQELNSINGMYEEELRKIFAAEGDVTNATYAKIAAYNKVDEKHKELIQSLKDLEKEEQKEVDAENKAAQDAEKAREKQAKDEEATMKKMYMDIAKYAKEYGRDAQTIANDIDNYFQQVYQNQATNAQNSYDTQLAALQSELDNGLISQDQFNTQKAALDANLKSQEDDIKNKENQAAKETSLFNIALSTAQAIASQIPNYWGMAAAAAMGAVELGIAAATPLPALASGGTATSGGSALVGEKGPEIIYMSKGASVVPLSAGAANGSGGNLIHTQINIDGKQIVEAIVPEITRQMRANKIPIPRKALY
jgi:hypothetical protein